jgi:hypothetical protein
MTIESPLLPSPSSSLKPGVIPKFLHKKNKLLTEILSVEEWGISRIRTNYPRLAHHLWLWKSQIWITPGAARGSWHLTFYSSEGAEYINYGKYFSSGDIPYTIILSPFRAWNQRVSHTPGCAGGYSYSATRGSEKYQLLLVEKNVYKD